MVGTELEYSQTQKKPENKINQKYKQEQKLSNPKKTKMILSCNNVLEVSLKLRTLPEHVANSTRHVAKAVAKVFLRVSHKLSRKTTNRNK